VPARVVKLLPEAEAEVIANERWYAQRSPTAAEAFIVEVDDAIARIGAAPKT
jgi:plasmid stabilization system protein ParE